MADCMVRFVTNLEGTAGKFPFGSGLNRKSPRYLRYGTAKVALPAGKKKDCVLKSVTLEGEGKVMHLPDVAHSVHVCFAQADVQVVFSDLVPDQCGKPDFVPNKRAFRIRAR
jgi:hypothetical protein